MKDKNAIPEEDPYQAQAQVFQEETAVAAAHVQYGESSYHGGAAAVSSQPTYGSYL
jgi:hypothetical protein